MDRGTQGQPKPIRAYLRHREGGGRAGCVESGVAGAGLAHGQASRCVASNTAIAAPCARVRADAVQPLDPDGACGTGRSQSRGCDCRLAPPARRQNPATGDRQAGARGGGECGGLVVRQRHGQEAVLLAATACVDVAETTARSRSTGVGQRVDRALPRQAQAQSAPAIRIGGLPAGPSGNPGAAARRSWNRVSSASRGLSRSRQRPGRCRQPPVKDLAGPDSTATGDGAVSAGPRSRPASAAAGARSPGALYGRARPAPAAGEIAVGGGGERAPGGTRSRPAHMEQLVRPKVRPASANTVQLGSAVRRTGTEPCTTSRSGGAASAQHGGGAQVLDPSIGATADEHLVDRGARQRGVAKAAHVGKLLGDPHGRRRSRRRGIRGSGR